MHLTDSLPWWLSWSPMNESCVRRAFVTLRMFLLVAPRSGHSEANCSQASSCLVIGWMLGKVCSVILLVIPGPPLEGLQARHKTVTAAQLHQQWLPAPAYHDAQCQPVFSTLAGELPECMQPLPLFRVGQDHSHPLSCGRVSPASRAGQWLLSNQLLQISAWSRSTWPQNLAGHTGQC